METKELYREILNEHNINPVHKTDMDSPTFCLEGVNPSCVDQIKLQLNLDDSGKITDASFVIGKTKEEALALADIFDRMIKDTVTEEDLERLDEAAALQDISHMPARVKCAMLGWRTMKEMLGTQK